MHAYTREVSARKSWQAGRQKNLNFTTKALVHVSGSMLSEQIIHSTFSPELLLIIAHSHALLIFFYLFKRLKLVNSKDKVHLDKVFGIGRSCYHKEMRIFTAFLLLERSFPPEKCYSHSICYSDKHHWNHRMASDTCVNSKVFKVKSSEILKWLIIMVDASVWSKYVFIRGPLTKLLPIPIVLEIN